MDIILTPPGFTLITVVAIQIVVSVVIYAFVDKKRSYQTR